MNCGCIAPTYGPSLANTCGGGSFVVFMTLVNSFITNQCDISEVCQRVIPRSQPECEYDFVVIGGGSAGAVVASRLSEIPEWKVLLVEAGGDEPPGAQVPAMVVNFQDTPIDWAYQTESEPVACLGYPDEKCSWPRGKVLGGTSVLNGMMYMRGQPKDYDNWKEAGNEGWGYNDVFPYFLKSEDNLEIGTLIDRRYHARGGYMTVSRFPNQPEIANDILAAAWELGYPISNDLTGEQYSGFAIAQACV
ncbi:glucose dehydrogenase [FAD, quinone]-like, partial [Agrilus planipennis]|uniref:Glucose dehydrogenase [FAD, quinone]-like n=1 Tax=Agrilus planipennis TaxID=224129 RepID=A0A7F5RK71_AGRPL